MMIFREGPKMRHTLKTIGLALLASAALISCSHEVLPVIETPEEKPIEKPTIHTIQIKADSQDTRTQIVETSSLWSEGDRLFVYQGYSAGKESWCQEAKASRPGTMINGGVQMGFEVDFDYVAPEDVESSWTDDDEEYKFLYQAVYPAENAEHICYDSDNLLVVHMPLVQHPTQTSFDPKADILTSRPAYLMQQPDDLSLAFKRQTALGQMTLKGLPEGAKLYGVAFYTSAQLYSAFAINVSSNAEMGWGYNNDGIVMQMPGWVIPAAGASGTTEILTSFMTSPFSLGEGGGFAVEVITKEMVEDDKTGESQEQLLDYIKVVQFEEGSGRELVFTAGDPTIFAVNMSGIEPEVIPDFVLTFDDETEYVFPHISDAKDPYIEIPYEISEDGAEVWISFGVNHPWSVSFSEPWLSASSSSGYPSYGAFKIYAEANDTGSPRQATMTIASQIFGEVKVLVVQPAMVLPDFELTFSRETLVTFPELAEGSLDLPFRVGGGGGGPKKTKVAPEDYIYLYFEISHPWTVSFSESWLSAYPSSGSPSYRDEDDDMVYGYFNLYATPNDTGEPREATMTIASRYSDEKVNIRVVQEALVLPNSITINAPSVVSAYSCFDVEAILGYPDGVDRGYEPWIDVVDGSENIKWVSNGRLAVNPGTVTFRAYLSHDVYSFLDEDYYLEAEAEVTITDGTAPTDWYFLVKQNDSPVLVHRSSAGDSSIPLPGSTEDVSVVANDLTLSSDGSLVYVVGAKPNGEGVLVPCMWTYDGSGFQSTDLNTPNNIVSGEAKKVVVEGGDVYIHALAKNSDYVSTNCLFKNNEVIWNGASSDEIFDLAVENGNFYFSGTDKFYNNNWSGGDPYLWTNGVSTKLSGYSTNVLIQQRYCPESILVRDGNTYIAGYFYARDKYSNARAFATMWTNGDFQEYYYSSSTGWWSCLYDSAFVGNDDDIILVGESYYNSSPIRQLKPALYLNYPFNNSYKLPLTYSGEVGLNEMHICNGIPVLRGTVDGTPAFWEAPWKDPIIWENTEDTMIGFAVK